MLKILEVVDSLDAGGMEAQLVALLNRLDPQRFHFHVVCLRHEGVHAARLRDGIQVTALHKADGFRWKVVRQLQGILQDGYDLVHTHNWAPLVYAALGSRGGLSASLFHGEHAQLTSAEKSWKRLWLRRLLYRSCTGVHTVSAGQRKELQECGLRHQRLVALINGVDTRRFHPAEKSAMDRTIGIVARFGSFKRHAALLEAFEKVAANHTEARLLIVGDGGPEKDAVSRLVESSAIRAQITMAGYQSDPVPWYRKMDALVVPSSNEGLSNATMEAMACGVPVLSNDICGAHELLGADEGGWVRNLSTVDKLATELEMLFSVSRDTLIDQGRKGRERVERLFSWDGMAQAYEQAFKDCARGQR
jgi:glycosyltransferase involved in cell wall biosynthesis